MKLNKNYSGEIYMRERGRPPGVRAHETPNRAARAGIHHAAGMPGALVGIPPSPISSDHTPCKILSTTHQHVISGTQDPGRGLDDAIVSAIDHSRSLTTSPSFTHDRSLRMSTFGRSADADHEQDLSRRLAGELVHLSW